MPWTTSSRSSAATSGRVRAAKAGRDDDVAEEPHTVPVPGVEGERQDVRGPRFPEVALVERRDLVLGHEGERQLDLGLTLGDQGRAGERSEGGRVEGQVLAIVHQDPRTIVAVSHRHAPRVGGTPRRCP